MRSPEAPTIAQNATAHSSQFQTELDAEFRPASTVAREFYCSRPSPESGLRNACILHPDSQTQFDPEFGSNVIRRENRDSHNDKNRRVFLMLTTLKTQLQAVIPNGSRQFEDLIRMQISNETTRNCRNRSHIAGFHRFPLRYRHILCAETCPNLLAVIGFSHHMRLSG